MASQALTCPECHDGEGLRRSRPRWYDLPFRLIGMRAYRCLMCDRRFHAWKHARASEKQVPGSSAAEADDERSHPIQ